MMRHMACVDTFSISASGRTELYVTVDAPPTDDPGGQAEALFAAVAAELRRHDARLVYERVFLTPPALSAATAARAAAYGDLDDGVPPAWLRVGPGHSGAVPGVQVQAVAGGAPPEVLEFNGKPTGRIVRCGDYDLLTVAGLAAPDAGPTREEQAGAMMRRAKAAVEQAGGNLLSVSRTWMWLGDILAWYDDFNRVRTDYFRECGLFDPAVGEHLPASTGVGVGPALDGHCTMDLVATIEPQQTDQQFLIEGGNQGSAFSYGSAFSRAARARTPGGETVYVSGTASIDADGNTTHKGDILAQIEDTIANVRAVLTDMGCTDDDVVQSVVYCMSPVVEQTCRSQFADLPWPKTHVIGDICRHDLLVEIEAAACPGAQRL